MNEIEWVELRKRYKEQLKVARSIIGFGFFLMAVGVWFLPAWWMKLFGFGIWTVLFGLLAYTGLQKGKPDENSHDFGHAYKSDTTGRTN